MKWREAEVVDIRHSDQEIEVLVRTVFDIAACLLYFYILRSIGDGYGCGHHWCCQR